MKKITLASLTLLLVFAASAQQARFGFKGGLNVSHLNNNDVEEFGSRLGYNVGFLAHIHVNRDVAVQPEIVYSSQGTRYTVSNGEHELHLDYVNIPVLLQFMFAGGVRFETGPQLGFLANVKDTRRGEETGNFTTDDFKSVDVSWAAGLGYVSASGLGIDARYNFGLSNINDAGTNRLRNSVFQVGLFYEITPMRRTVRHYRR